MKRFIIILLFSILPQLAALAQTDDRELINTIKMDDNYIYSETTLEKRDEAISFAKELLRTEINAWLIQKDSGYGEDELSQYVSNGIKQSSVIETMRGTSTRAFVYVLKSTILSTPISSAKQEKETNSAPPVKEQAQEPVKEAEPIKEPIKEPVKEADTKPVKPEGYDPLTSSRSAVGNMFVGKVCDAANLSQVEAILEQMSANKIPFNSGKVSRSTRSDILDESILIVYDKENKVRAILGERFTQRTNLLTGNTDSTKNYRGCSVMWVCFKKY